MKSDFKSHFKNVDYVWCIRVFRGDKSYTMDISDYFARELEKSSIDYNNIDYLLTTVKKYADKFFQSAYSEGEIEEKTKEILASAQEEARQIMGEAEAKAIEAKAVAEAEGLLKKAEAMKQYGEAAMADMQMQVIGKYFEQLPAIAEAIGKGYAGADIHLIGNDSGQLAGNMMGNMTQIIEGFKGATGVDPMSVISGMIGAKIADNNG